MTERDLANELMAACRQLLRYDGIDKDRVRYAVDQIREIVDQWLALDESGELDNE